MTERLIKNCRYYQDHRFIKGDLLFRDGKVASDTRAGENASVVDAEGRYLVPGFLDIHTHGGNNIDVNAASPRDIETIASFFASHGTTGFQTSILTDTPEKTLECIGNVAATKKDDYDGAEIIGIHLEGPFLSPMYKGAMPEELLRPADPAWLEACLHKGEGLVRYMTVAPEVEGVKDLIRDFAESRLHWDTPVRPIRTPWTALPLVQRPARTHSTACGSSISMSPPSWVLSWRVMCTARQSVTADISTRDPSGC